MRHLTKRTASVVAGLALAASVVAASPNAQAKTEDGGTVPPRVSATASRVMTLVLPTRAKVGTSVYGYIQVASRTGATVLPAQGVEVAFQEKRGTQWVTLGEGLTDANGQYPVGFTADVNSVYRPVLTSSTGAKVAGTQVAFSAEALVTWAARPDMDVTGALKSTYTFRVVAVGTPAGYLEYAKASAPNRWFKAKVTTSKTDVLSQTLVFPGKGTYLVRGTSVATKSTAAGRTSTLTVDVG